MASRLPGDREYLPRDEFIRDHGASADDIDAVVAHAVSTGLTVVETAPERRCVVLSGTVTQFDSAFGTESGIYRHGTTTYRSHDNPVHIPEDLSEIVVAVLGLDDRKSKHHAVTNASFGFTEHEEVMKAYEFPSGADGRGQCIGIISVGGGFHETDLEGFLSPGQEVHVVELDGQKNDPLDRDAIGKIWEYEKRAIDGEPINPKDVPKELTEQGEKFLWTVETTADIQHALRFARGVEIVVYFAPGTIQGEYTAFTTAMVDPRSPSVLSCSWGRHEDHATPNHLHTLDDVLSFAALRGITLCFSSGDDGDGTLAHPPAVCTHFPASSPHVLACGGTMPARTEGQIGEVVWEETFAGGPFASGGGVSDAFGTPWWQPADLIENNAGGRRGRGVPDVAGKADMLSGYRIKVGGIDMPVGGTSSAAPLWAGLVACINQKLGSPAGFVNALLYQHREQFGSSTHTVSEGSNGTYHAAMGWDACTGWGSPRGTKLLRALRGE